MSGSTGAYGTDTREHTDVFSCVCMCVQVVEQVIKAGATTIMIPDTVGWQLSPEYSKLISHIKVRVRRVM